MKSIRFLRSPAVLPLVLFTFLLVPSSVDGVTIPFTISAPGRVSLAIYGPGGNLVRTLLTGKPHEPGKFTIEWDGRDRYGNALPTGEYSWKLLATPGLRAEFITQVGQNPDPVWERSAGNHQPPNAAAVDETGVYRLGSVNEGGHWGVKTDLDGRYLWTTDYRKADPWMSGGEALTLLNGRLYELMRDGTVYGLDAATGEVFTKKGAAPYPWNLRWRGFQATSGVSDDARRKQCIAERPHDLCGDVTGGLLVACYPQHNAVAWFDGKTGALVDTAVGIHAPTAVAASKDGTVFVLSQGAVCTLTRRDKTPRTLIAADRMTAPWRLCVSPKSGDVYVAENSDLAYGELEMPVPDVADGKTPDLSAGGRIKTAPGPERHQVQRFSPDGRLLKSYGRPEGRSDGVYVPTDFRCLTDIEADMDGGFVVTEGNQTPPRRSARLDSGGKLLREWYGAQLYGVIAGPEPDDPRHVWFFANADKPGLVRCEVDYEKRSWKVVEIYRDVFSRNPFARVPSVPTLFEHGGRIYIQGGGVHPVGLSLSVYDPATKRIRPCNAGGSRNKRAYLWNDLNDDGLAGEDEIEWVDRNMVGGHVVPETLMLLTTVMPSGYSPGDILEPSRITPGGTPVYDLSKAGKYAPWEEHGMKNFPFDFRRDTDGSWYACFSNSFSNPAEGTENHGAWYYNSCSAIDRLVKWDRDWNQLWSVGKHSADNDHEPGTTAMPRGLVGLVHGCVVWADASDEEASRPSVWTGDGLYVDELLRVPIDTLRKEEYGEKNANEFATGHITIDPKSGDTYYYAINSAGGSPIYRITGWEGWQRSSGRITLAKESQPGARRSGTGLTGEYFNTPDCTGKPSTVRVDKLVSFHWLNGMDPLPREISGDTFSCRWTGRVEAPTSEKYRFVLETMTPWRGGGWGVPGVPRRVKLWIGGVPVIDTDSGMYHTTSFAPPVTSVGKDGELIWDSVSHRESLVGADQGLYGEVMLRAGERYDLRLECTYTGNAVAKLCWETPGLDRRVILSEYLYPEPGSKTRPDGIRETRPELIADFGFEQPEGNLFRSRTGGDVFGRLTGNTNRVPGKTGSGIQFNAKGESAPALFPIDEELRLPETGYSVAFWFRTSDPEARLCEARRYSSYNNIWSDHGVSLESGKVRFQLHGDTALETPDALNDGIWHQVVTTVGEGGQRLYVDGKLVATGKLSRRMKSSNRLGLDLGPGSGKAVVALDEVRIYSRALTAAEVKKNYRPDK